MKRSTGTMIMNSINRTVDDWIESIFNAGFLPAMGLIFGVSILLMVIIGGVIGLIISLAPASPTVTYPAANCINTTILVGKVIMPAIACHQ